MLGGSLVKGFGRPGSDVDMMLVVGEAAYSERQRTGELTFYTAEYADYDGGYVDGKYVARSFLELVADKGSEPSRAAFWQAYVAWSRPGTPPLEELIARITAYPEQSREANIARFVAQVRAMDWYVGEAETVDNPYLLNWSAVRAVLFTGRILLAHNRLLYPYHKWLLATVALAPDKPATYVKLADELMRTPTAAGTRELCELVLTFRDWGEPSVDWPAQFLQDSELNWLHGHTPIEDL